MHRYLINTIVKTIKYLMVIAIMIATGVMMLYMNYLSWKEIAFICIMIAIITIGGLYEI